MTAKPELQKILKGILYSHIPLQEIGFFMRATDEQRRTNTVN